MANERFQLALTRITNVLRKHGIALSRTLEQKISDAGPYGQRIDPHVLTTARNHLNKEKRVVQLYKIAPWYHLTETPTDIITRRLSEQLSVFKAMQRGDTGSRIGQALEIAIYRALLRQDKLEHFGSFLDLDEHDDSTLYSKEEPPASLSGRRILGKQRLDFLVHHETAGWAGIESKNIREWLYPSRKEIEKGQERQVFILHLRTLICQK